MMARCESDSRSNVSLMSSLKKVAVKAKETQRHEYANVPVTVRVVDVRRRFLLPIQMREFPELERLYKHYVVSGNLYVNFLVVCDSESQFVNLLLNPRFNREMDQLKVKCGDVIKLTNYGCRVISGLDLYFEICGFELCGTSETNGEWSSWKYDLQTTKEVGEAIESINEKCPIPRAVPFRLWHESVPLWPTFVASSQDPPDAATSAESLARSCGQAEIAHIYENWRSVREPFPYLVCRIRSRGNHEFYKSNSLHIRVPMKINLNVYDCTGGCSVVIWDQVMSEEDASRLHEGAVILLRNYSVKMNLSNSKYKVDFGDLRRFPIELHVQDDRVFRKKAMEVVPPEFALHPDCSRHLPTVGQPCNAFPDILARRSTRFECELQMEEVFPVAGLVVGLSRYYRLRREGSASDVKPIGRFYTSRWVEIYDPSSGLFLNVEVFVNKQIDRFAALEIGDVAAFTFVRLCQRKASNIKEDSSYVTTTQCTELFLMKRGASVDEPPGEIPTAVRKEMRRIRIEAGERRDPEHLFWLGGAHQFVNTYYSNQVVHKLFSTDEKVFEDLAGFLKNLAFWESKDLMFSGQIVLVEFCAPESTSCELLCERDGKIRHTSTVIAKANFWDAMKEAVPLYGSTCPHYLTLPMKFVEKNRSLLHEALQFPRTNIYERELQLELAENEDAADEHFEVLSRGYYRIVVLRRDKKVAVSSFFLPMVSKMPPTLIQSLHLSHLPIRKPMESPVNRNMEYSEFDIRECSQTASFVLDKDVDVVLQTRCMGFNDYEILFCQLYFKNSEDERLY